MAQPLELTPVIPLLAPATTGAGEISLTGSEDFVKIYIFWGASTSAGAITIEESPFSGFPGTWSELIIVNWAAANSMDTITLERHIYHNIRTRISTTVVGGVASTFISARRAM